MFKIKITKNKEKKVENLYTTLNRKQRFLPSLKNEKYRTTFARVHAFHLHPLVLYTHTSHAHTSVLERENDAKRLDIITLDQEFDLLRGLLV